MKKYNFTLNHTPITRGQFEKAVPGDWENEIDDYGSYTHGYYRAEEIEEPSTAGRKPLPPGQKKVAITIYIEENKLNLVGKQNFRIWLESFARDTVRNFEYMKMTYESNIPFIPINGPVIRDEDYKIVIESMKKRGIIA